MKEMFKDVLGGMDPEDMEGMPPFPLPREFFPKGTIPEGMKTTMDHMKGMPPSVVELIETGEVIPPPPPPLPRTSLAGLARGSGSWRARVAALVLFDAWPRCRGAQGDQLGTMFEEAMANRGTRCTPPPNAHT